MSELYDLKFEPSKSFSEALLQHQIGINFIVDSYLMMYDKRFIRDDDLEEHIASFSPLIFFKDINYFDGDVDNDSKEKYNEYKQNIFEHTIKLEKYSSRSDTFEFKIPMTKDRYNLNGNFSANVIALFGKNYYTDENIIQNNLMFIGYLYFENDYIPLYNSKTYGLQINASLNYSINVVGGSLDMIDNRNNVRMIRTYYDGENAKCINIMNNVILK